MNRFVMWSLFTIVTLGLVSFDVRYRDGLHIKSVGWPERLSLWRKKRNV